MTYVKINILQLSLSADTYVNYFVKVCAKTHKKAGSKIAVLFFDEESTNLAERTAGNVKHDNIK